MAGEIDKSPKKQRKQSPGSGSVEDDIGQLEKPIVQCTDKEKPTETKKMASDELPMSAKSFAESLVMQDERDLHGGKTDNEGRHDATAGWQIIEHSRQVAEISHKHWTTE